MLGSLLGEGRTAAVYAHKKRQDLVVKLFFERYGRETAEYEYKVATAVAASGLPVPQVMELVQLDGRYGIVYQRVRGESMLRALLSCPDGFDRGARQLAEEHARIHRAFVPGLPRQRQWLTWGIQQAGLTKALQQAALEQLAELPDGEYLCHGDFHPDNLILTDGGPVVIDWNNASGGHPLADVARTSLLLTVGEVPGAGEEAKQIRVWRQAFRDAYVEHYLQLGGFGRDEFERWQLPVIAARLAENIPGERELLREMLRHAGTVPLCQSGRDCYGR